MTGRAAWIRRLEPAEIATVVGDAPADGPLAGLAFAVKDNIDVAGVPTTAAFLGLEGAVGARLPL